VSKGLRMLWMLPLLGLMVLWYLSMVMWQLGSWIMVLGELLESGADHGFNWLLSKVNK